MSLHTARNALVVFVAAMLGYCLTLQPWFNDQISLIDYKNGKLPPIQVPDPTSDVCSVSASITIHIVVSGLNFSSGSWYRDHYGAADQLFREHCNSQSIW